MSKLLTTPATISKVQTMSHRSLRLQVDTNEALSDEEVAKIMSNYEKFGYFCFIEEKHGDIKPEDLVDLPKLPATDESSKKTPSQRLRNVLYIEWKTLKTKEYQDRYPFEIYYNGEMSRVIEGRKDKLL